MIKRAWFKTAIYLTAIYLLSSNSAFANGQNVQYTTLSGLPDTESTKFIRINSKQVIDDTVKWYVNNLSNFIHGDAEKTLNLVEKSRHSIDALNAEINRPIDTQVSKSIESVLNTYINIETSVKLFNESGLEIIKNQDQVISESESKLNQIKNFESIYKYDQEILMHNIKNSEGREKERIQQYYEDWKITTDDTLVKINDIYENLNSLRNHMLEIKSITRPFLDTLIKQIPQEVRLGYDNTLTTLRAEQTCPCYKELKANRISLDGLSEIVKNEMDKIKERIPKIHEQTMEISEKMGYRDRKRNEDSIWIKLTDSVNDYKQQWNATAVKIESWNNLIWINSLESKEFIAINIPISCQEWDEINKKSKSKQITLDASHKLRFYAFQEDDDLILMKSLTDDKIYSFSKKTSLTDLTKSQSAGI